MHAEAIACTECRPRRNCREHKVLLSSRIFRLERTFSLRLHARRPISSTNQMKENPMVLKTTNLNRIVASPPVRAPATLREVHDHNPDPRIQSALRRLQRLLSIPLESMPADIDWFDARFPKCSCDGGEAAWTSARAYNRWRSTIRRAIRRDLFALGTSNFKHSPLQVRHLSVSKAHDQAPTSATRILAHVGSEIARARYGNFRKAVPRPKSD